MPRDPHWPCRRRDLERTSDELVWDILWTRVRSIASLLTLICDALDEAGGWFSVSTGSSGSSAFKGDPIEEYTQFTPVGLVEEVRALHDEESCVNDENPRDLMAMNSYLDHDRVNVR